MRIGFSELLVVMVVALLVLGPDKLPFYAAKCGRALTAFRRASEEAAEEWKKNVTDPLENAASPRPTKTDGSDKSNREE